MKEEDQDPSRYPRPLREKAVPKDVSLAPTSRDREGTEGPRALTNIPSKKKDANKASEGDRRWSCR